MVRPTSNKLLHYMNYYFIYVLRGRRGFIYVGYTTDYKKRIKRHNNGEVQSTKAFKPFRLIFLEVYINKSDAKRREKYLKTSKGRTTLKAMLKNTLGK